MTWMGRQLEAFGPLKPAERKLVDEMGAGLLVEISPGVPVEGPPAEHRLRARFVRYLARSGCGSCRPPHEQPMDVRGSAKPRRSSCGRRFGFTGQRRRALCGSMRVFVLPIVCLAIQTVWIPDGSTACGWWARVYLWFHIVVGCGLSLLAVAGFSGLVKSS